MTGLLDTVKFKLEAEMSCADKSELRAKGFRYMRNQKVLDEGSGEVYNVREMFHDEKTGVRVLADENNVVVEGSIPRVLGLDNALQEQVTESDTFEAFGAMTSDLLPFTSQGRHWGLTRLDMARNFKADVPCVIGAYSILTHPEIRSKAKIMFGESVSYFGCSREVVIYDKGAEMGTVPGQLGRAECRWMGMRGLDKFCRLLDGSRASYEKPDTFSLPIFFKQTDGAHSYRQVVYVQTDNTKLNDIMRSDISKLGTPNPVPVFRDLTEVALHALLTHPEEYTNFFEGLYKEKAYRYRKQMRSYIQRYADVDLVKLIWKDAA